MDRTRVELRRAGRVLAAVAMLAMAGCQTVRTKEEAIAATPLPRELNMTSLPEYVVAPPDFIEIVFLVWREIPTGRDAQGNSVNQWQLVPELSDPKLVRPDGTITLGRWGDLYVAGLTLPEIKEKVIIHLREYYSDEDLGLIGEGADGEPITIHPRDSDRVFVDVTNYESQFFYVAGDVNAPGRLPVTGNDTVLDALMFAGGLAPTASIPNVRLVRPAPPGSAKPQVLPVNLAAILQEGDTTTNYQMMPGDRLYVYRDPIVRTTVFIDRLAAPFNTVVNTILQFSFMQRSVISANIPINAGNNASTNNTGRGFNNVSPNSPAR